MKAPSLIRHAANEDLARLQPANLRFFVVLIDVEQKTDEGKPVRGTGTGLIIRSPRAGKPGLILTCAHVLSGGGRETIKVRAYRDGEGAWDCSADPLHLDTSDDWAVVTFDKKLDPVADVRLKCAVQVPKTPGFSPAEPASGNLFVVDFPGKDPRLRNDSALAQGFEYAHCKVGDNAVDRNCDDVRAYRYFVGTEPGTSGSPVVTASGEILGLHGSSEICNDGLPTRLGRALSIHRILRQLALRNIATDIDGACLPVPVASVPVVPVPVVPEGPGRLEKAWTWLKRRRGWIAAALALTCTFAYYLLKATPTPTAAPEPSLKDFYTQLLTCWFSADGREYAEKKVTETTLGLNEANDGEDEAKKATATSRVIDWNYYAAYSDFMLLVDCAAPSRPKGDGTCKEYGPAPQCSVLDVSLRRIKARLDEVDRIWDRRPKPSVPDAETKTALARAKSRTAYADWLEVMVSTRFGDFNEDTLLARMHSFQSLHPCSKHVQSMSLTTALLSLNRKKYGDAFKSLGVGLRRVDGPITAPCFPDPDEAEEIKDDFAFLTMPELAHCFERPKEREARSIFCATYMETKRLAGTAEPELEARCGLAPVKAEAQHTVKTLLEQLERRVAGKSWIVGCVGAEVPAVSPPFTPPVPRSQPGFPVPAPAPVQKPSTESAGGATDGEGTQPEAPAQPGGTAGKPGARSVAAQGDASSIAGQRVADSAPANEATQSDTNMVEEGKAVESGKCTAIGLRQTTAAANDRAMRSMAKLTYSGGPVLAPAYPVPEGRTLTTSVHLEGELLVLVARVKLGTKVESSTVYAVNCGAVEASWAEFSQHEVAQFKGDLSPLVLVPSKYKIACVWLFMIGDDGSGAPRIQVADLRLTGKKLSCKGVETTNIDRGSGAMLPTLEKFRSKEGRKVDSINVRYDEERKEVWREFPRPDKNMKFWRATAEKSAGVEDDSEIGPFEFAISPSTAIAEIIIGASPPGTTASVYAGDVASARLKIDWNRSYDDSDTLFASAEGAFSALQLPQFRFFSDRTARHDNMLIYATDEAVYRCALLSTAAPEEVLRCADAMVTGDDSLIFALVRCPLSGQFEVVGFDGDPFHAGTAAPP